MPRLKSIGIRRRAAVPALTALALIALVVFAFSLRSRSIAAGRLPPLPDLTGRPPLLVEHVQSADRIARRSPQSADAVGSLGMAYHADLFLAEAAAAYALASQLDGRDWRWSYYEALVHGERGESSRSVAALQLVVGSRPDLGLAWWRLGEALFKQAKYDEADLAYQRVESSPAADRHTGVMPYARVGRARVALNRGEAASAIATLSSLLDDAPRFGPAHRLLADAYRAAGRETDAERHRALGSALRAYAGPPDPLIDALADGSRSSIFLLRQAASLDLAEEAARRERLVRRALESDPDNPDVVYEMGALLQQLRRPSDALPYFTRHLDLVTDDQQTLVQIGKVYSDLARWDEAEATLKKALALGDDATGYYNLGVVLEQRDQLAEAEACYRRAVALGPGLAAARNNLGALLAARGRVDEATTHLMESIRLDPAMADAYTNLSAVKLQQGRVGDAIRYATLALEINPRQADAHANLGVAFARQGDLDKARREFEAALVVNPRHATARQNLDALKGRD